ncbi:ATP-binding protein [Carboxylicivirga taeanensis]|uniref:ATP-binding protein n=1 Tax=Carboxylicivirga taeanensis TaxID=1416875 RepID=UPI003F6E1461
MSDSLNKIKFQVETQRVLEILSNEIYDSSYALMRENIQNAYDAILMRKSLDEGVVGKIEIEISSTTIKIRDNGIGMSEDVLRENFWKAGSSGKRGNELAEKAGVIGTFGIGAMANFGVCERLEVITRPVDSESVYKTIAVRENLSISEDCIELEKVDDDTIPVGTTLIAYLDNQSQITHEGAIDYLSQYIKYLPIEVNINGINCSQKDYKKEFLTTKETSTLLEFNSNIQEPGISCVLSGVLTRNNIIRLNINNIIWQNNSLSGEIVLEQGKGHIMGLRNYFGMAPVPISQIYNFGGIVNLSILQPTAGREALSRESISFVTSLIVHIEKAVSEEISNTEQVDKNPYFLNYIVKRNRYDLANNININLKPEDINVPLKQIEELKKQKQLRYYSGNDSSIIQLHANENTNLLVLSQSNPRRRIQQNYLSKLKVEPVNDNVQVSKIYERMELEMSESAIIFKLISILNEDYFLNNCNVQFADITHNIPLLVQKKGDTVLIFLSRNTQSVQQLKQTYSNAYEIFNSFLKDFIRNHIYSKIAPFVPSSTRQGADALQKILSKNKELYKYEYNEQGEIESLLSDYLKGDISLPEALKKSKTITKTHTQRFSRNQVGTIETELPNIIHDAPAKQPEQNSSSNGNGEMIIALPPILRLDSETTKKLITTTEQRHELNMFRMFLGLSDQIYKKDKDFFLEPHTTKVIWGGHKVVFIFSHVTSRLTLYYDIELKDKLKDETIGGGAIATTTIVTGNRIFVPVPEHLESSFYIEKGKKEFFVRYDLIIES